MNTAAYRLLHARAMRNPLPVERPIVSMLGALVDYAELHTGRYGSPIGEDSVLGSAWLDIAAGVLALLDGETGRLDCGTLDGFLRDLAHDAGFSDAECEAAGLGR